MQQCTLDLPPSNQHQHYCSQNGVGVNVDTNASCLATGDESTSSKPSVAKPQLLGVT